MGSGGAPEGVITAAAIRCLNGYMQGRLVIDKPEMEERIAKMGIKDKKKIYEAEDLAPGKQMIFAATGVTEGALLKGVRFFGEGTRTSSVILTLKTGRVRFIESIHLDATFHRRGHRLMHAVDIGALHKIGRPAVAAEEIFNFLVSPRPMPNGTPPL